jgi:hypothetical protein
MFSISRSTKKFPQLKMSDNCVKSYNFAKKITNVALVIVDPLSKKIWAEVPHLMYVVNIAVKKKHKCQ